MATTVLVVDDHQGFRDCARRMLEQQGFEVVGEAADGASAIVAAEHLRPRLALVDVHLPDCDGFMVADHLAALEDPPAVVLISSHDRRDLEPLVPSSAARGFVPKHELSRDAIEALIG